MNVNNAVITSKDFERLNDLLQCPHSRFYGPMIRLEQGLSRSRVVVPVRVGRDVVTMNSKVRVRDLERDVTEVLTLAYPDDADIDHSKVSVAAPLGAALLGAKRGQSIEFAAPRGTRKVRIERILYQPERAGHYHL